MQDMKPSKATFKSSTLCSTSADCASKRRSISRKSWSRTRIRPASNFDCRKQYLDWYWIWEWFREITSLSASCPLLYCSPAPIVKVPVCFLSQKTVVKRIFTAGMRTNKLHGLFPNDHNEIIISCTVVVYFGSYPNPRRFEAAFR